MHPCCTLGCIPYLGAPYQPEPSDRPAAQWVLLDHLVGAREHRCGNVDADRLGSLDVDNELKLGALWDGQIAGFLAFENAADIDASLTSFVSRAKKTLIGRGAPFLSA